jgi:hypothetical protein
MHGGIKAQACDHNLFFQIGLKTPEKKAAWRKSKTKL